MSRDGRATAERRRLIVLGCTGSIGSNVMRVVSHLDRRGRPFEIVGLAAGSNAGALAECARAHRVQHIAIADPTHADDLRGEAGTIYAGPEAARDLIDAVARPGDLVVCAVVGAAGVPGTLAAIERGCDVALANKEALVAAGELVMQRVREKGVTLLPIDSEHSAVFQCLLAGRSIEEVRRLVITASGGPFRTWPRQRMARATVDEALAHPTWNMGPKNTIDSASLINKALEVVEAHWLFGLPAAKIDAIVHPQSLVHSFVEFVDGSIIAQMAPPDMKIPIQYALTYPQRLDGTTRPLDWSALRTLDFEPIDGARFPAVGLAHRVIETGGTAGAIFNAANEAAVDAFRRGEIRFGGIVPLVEAAMDAVPVRPVTSLADVEAADTEARAAVVQRIAAESTPPTARRVPQPNT